MDLYIHMYIYYYIYNVYMYIYIYINLFSHIFDVDNVDNVDNVNNVNNVDNDYKVSDRTLGPSFHCHNKSTLYPTFSTPTLKSRRIGYTRRQGLSSEEVYSSKTAIPN